MNYIIIECAECVPSVGCFLYQAVVVTCQYAGENDCYLFRNTRLRNRLHLLAQSFTVMCLLQ